jgi:chromosome segregation ATPase
VHGFTDRLTVERKALDAFDERSRVLQASIAEAEKKVDEQAARDRRAQAFDQRAELMTKQLEALHAQAGELQLKHSALESLQDSLAEVDVLAKKTASQYESLKHGRQEIDAFRAEIQEVFKSHASAIQLRDRLSSDRAALESFIDRTDAFSAGVPQLQTQLTAIAQKLATIEAGSQQAEKLAAVAADLERQMKRIAGQEQFVERVGARLEALSELTVEVDGKMGDQISRRGEVDTLRSQMEGVTIQVADARQKLEDVSVLQEQLVPLTTQLSELAHQIETAQARFRATQKDEATLADQERRLAALDDSARTTAQQVAERLTQVHALSDELGRSVEARDRLLEELANVQARQHDVATQMDAADGQLARLDATAKDLEQRGSQLAFAEKRIGAFEGRLVDLSQMANQIETTIQNVAQRESVVDAVRKEVHRIHELSARSKSDLEHVESHRAEMLTLREQLDGLLAAIAETETRIAAIDGRRKVVDEVQLKTNAIVNMLEDVRLNMDTLGEHKTIMEQAMGDFARLTELVQESQTTLRALKAERELAGRIERGTKRLRAKTDRGQSGVKPTSGQDATA